MTRVKKLLSLILCTMVVVTNFSFVQEVKAEGDGNEPISVQEDTISQEDIEDVNDAELEGEFTLEAEEETEVEPKEEVEAIVETVAEAEAVEEPVAEVEEVIEVEEESEAEVEEVSETETEIQDEESINVEYTSGTLTAEENDYSIVLSYNAASEIPEGAKLEVIEITAEASQYDAYVKKAAEIVTEKNTDATTLPYARFFDISIVNAEGEKVEPKSAVTVSIDLKDDVLATEDVDFSAVHFKDENVENEQDIPEITETTEVEIVDMQTAVESESAVSFDADSFSVYGVVYYYTVDFYYTPEGVDAQSKPVEYHMNGGSWMMLSELFEKLGIDKKTADVKEVSFTNESLVSFTKEGSDYRIKSLKPFTTGEMLTITFNDGSVISITVEDEIASGTFGNNLKWSIDDEGHFILEPASGSNGTITTQYSSATSALGTTPRTNGRQLWPWEAYKDKIVTAEIKGEIRTYGGDNNYALQGMFDWCSNMVSVDVSGLNTSRLGDVSFFFANCSKLKTITGLDAWVESVHQGDGNKYGVGNIRSIASMFRNCTSLEEIDLSSWTSDGKIKNFQNMCTGCTSLKSFKLNNANFKTAAGSQWHTGSNGPFKDCNALETVDMSNITVATNDYGFKEMFAGLSSLKEVTMKDMDFSMVKNLEGMFNNCSNLETLTFSPKEGAAFDGNYIHSMDNLFANCSKIKTLDITNLDNSKMTYNHQLGFEDLDSLTTLKADNTMVWIAKNNVDTVKMNMERVNMVRDIDFIQDADFEYTPSPKDPNYSGETPLIIDASEVVELVVKDGTSTETIGYTNTNDKGQLSPGTYVRTSIIDNSDMEVPLTYYIIDGMDENMPIIEFLINGEWKIWDATDVNSSSFVEGDMGNYYVFSYPTTGGYDTRIFTKAKTNDEWKNGIDAEDRYLYEGDKIRITYPNSATSINGTKHDVVVTINKITFEDMSRIPNSTDSTYTNFDENFIPVDINNPWGPGTRRSDMNKIAGYKKNSIDNEKTRRYLLNASVGELRFWNQILKEEIGGGDGADAFAIPDSKRLYSKGSGTYIDFDLNIDGAEDGQSVLYWCDDLDMPENESWTMTDENPDNDVRNAVNYAPGAEGIVLGKGNDLSSVTLANRTYLELYNYADGTKMNGKETDGSIQGDNNTNTTDVANYLIGTRPDPETKKTRFYVKSNAKGSNYIWTTGTSCETTVLKSTSFERADVLDVHINAKAAKTVNSNEPPTNLDRVFNFVMEAASDISTVDVGSKSFPNKAGTAFPEPIKVNNMNGNVDFGKITFISPGANFVDTGKHDPIFLLYKVYMDSDNKKFFYNGEGKCKSWTETVTTEQVADTDENGNPIYDAEGIPVMVDKEVVKYEEFDYDPVIETTKAYVFKLTEKEGSEAYITDWDGTEYYLKVVTIAPLNDEEMLKGTKIEVTVGTKKEGASSITWGATTTKYGEDTKDTPLEVNVGTFNNKADEVELPKGSINVKKILDGRNWKDSDKFHFVLTTEELDTPMPTGSQVTDGFRHADLDIDMTTDTKVNEHSYKDSEGFNEIIFTGAHMVNDSGAPVSSKTFTYHIREEVPSESGDERIAGITYSTERYAFKVTVTNQDGELKVAKTETVPVTDGTEGTAVDIASFTNTYNANETTYKMSAEKTLSSDVANKKLEDGDYQFIMKPIGTYASIAPMPKNTTGTGEDRQLKVGNIGQGVKFEDASDSNDGLRFLYQDNGEEKGLLTLLLPYFENSKSKVYEALHSDEGVDFEYEIYEAIPDNAINNNNGTWSISETNGHISIYDGIHHTRKITIKVRPKDGSLTEEELFIESHADDHKEDFYIDKDGNEKPVGDIDGYDASTHHLTPDGAPIFHNYYLMPVKVDPPVKKVVEGTDANDPFTYTFKPISNTVGIAVSDMPMPEGSADGQKQITKDGPGEYEFGEFELSLPGTYVYEITEDKGNLKYDYDTSKYTVTYDVKIINHKLVATTTITKDDNVVEKAEFTNPYMGDGEIGDDESYGVRGEIQTGKPDYKKNPKNQVTPKNLVKPEVEGAEISSDGKTVTIMNEGKYVLNSDGSITFTPEPNFVGDPTPIQVEGIDKLGDTVSATYTPHVIDLIEEGEAKRTVHFTRETKDGEKVKEDEVQTATLRRHATTLKKDAEGKPVKDAEGNFVPETWGDWSTETLPAVDNPDEIAGKDWYTNDKVEAYEMKEPGEIDETVIYYKKPAADEKKTYGGRGENQSGTPPFEEGSKKITGYELIDPKTGEPAVDNKVTIEGEGTYELNPETGEVTFMPEYDFVGVGTTVTVRATDEDGNTAEGKYTPTVVDNIQEVTKTRKITYVYEDGSPVLNEDGNPLVDTYEITFQRSGYVNPETGEVTNWLEWYPIDIPEVVSPSVEGYTPDKASVPAVIGATPDNWPSDEVVSYKKNHVPEPTGPIWIDGMPYETVDKVGKTQKGTLRFKPGIDSPLDHVRLIDPTTGNEVDGLDVDVYENGKKIGTYRLNPIGNENEDGTVSYDITFTPIGDYIGTPKPITLRVYDVNGKYADGIYQPKVVGEKTPVNPTPNKDSVVDTSDDTNISFWGATLVASLVLIGMLLGILRKYEVVK